MDRAVDPWMRNKYSTISKGAYSVLFALPLCFAPSRASAYEPSPGLAAFFNRSGVPIPVESLRFAESGWQRGRDQGFAVALQRSTSYFYLWIETARGDPLGRNLLCDGHLLKGHGQPLNVDSILSFAVGDLAGKGSNFLIAVTDGGRSLVVWNLSSCSGQGSVKAYSEISTTGTNGVRATIRGDVIAGDFDGRGKDLIQAIDPETGEFTQWTLDSRDLILSRHGVLSVGPNSTAHIHGIKYVATTRLPHDSDNVAYESATLILHAAGATVVRDGRAVAFSPNCNVQPTACADKTLLFNLDQGFSGGLQDLARTDRPLAGEVLKRIIAVLHRAQTRFVVWALINPIQEDREATLFVLDELTRAGIPFVLDYYSSDVTSLASIQASWLDYKPRAFAALKGVSLDVNGDAGSSDSLEFYSRRYGAKFVGLRQMERLGIDITTKDPNGQPMIADAELAKSELTFDWQIATRALEWANASGRYVLWSDPALYVPYECYRSPVARRIDDGIRDDYVAGEMKLAKRYPNLVPIYNNNEGLKRCGVAYGDWMMTPRNFRLSGWERIPSKIAATKRGSGSLSDARGFGLSVQSWTSDYDPILNAATLPPEEIVIWALDGFAKGASILEFEPYFYFFAWPPSAFGVSQSLPLSNGQHIGDARATLELLFSHLGIGDSL
jgi:hypothetical protein